MKKLNFIIYIILILTFSNCSADPQQCDNAVKEDRLTMKNVRMALDSGNMTNITHYCKEYVLTNKRVQNYCSDEYVSTAKQILLGVSNACSAKGVDIN